MSVFSTNQARQLYVLKGSLQTDSAPTTTNTIQVKVTDPNAPYIVAMGAKGKTRSDLLTNVKSVRLTEAPAAAKSLKSTRIAFAQGVTPTAGKDYLVTATISQFVGLSDEEKYFKHGSARAKSDSASAVLADIATTMAKSLSKDAAGLLQVVIGTSNNTTTTVTAQTTLDPATNTYTYILLNEVEQEWTLGVKPLVPVNFSVHANLIGDVAWATITDNTSTYGQSIVNSKTVADLEYFCMGERGDIYRGMNWPHVIHTDYLVDASNTYGYDILDVEYFYQGGAEDVQKSPKVLTVVAPRTSAAAVSALASLANAIAKAAGFANYKAVKGADDSATPKKWSKGDLYNIAVV